MNVVRRGIKYIVVRRGIKYTFYDDHFIHSPALFDKVFKISVDRGFDPRRSDCEADVLPLCFLNAADAQLAI